MKNFIKTTLMLLALLLPATANAHDFEVDGIFYNIKGSKVTVTYEGDNYYGSSSNKYTGYVTIPETVTYNGVTYAVTSIGDHAFYDCVNLGGITIPNSITSIGDYAFNWCSGLTSITIPKSVTSIGDKVLTYCSGLTSIVVDSDNQKYDSRDNCNAIISTSQKMLVAGCQNTIIPDGVTIIGESAFHGCIGLRGITIPSSVKSIKSYAFHHCTSLTDVVIPNSVTSLGYFAFYGCSSLKSVTIGNSVTTIGGEAFDDCISLTSVNIPSSVTSIGSWAFRNCRSLTSITVESGNTHYDSRDNCNAIIETASNKLIAGCQNTIIPKTVTAIGSYAFSKCNNLSSVSIPKSITSIESSAFWDCRGLTAVYSYITDLSAVTMEDRVFSFFNSNNYTGRTLYVPQGTAGAYQADENWYPYFEQIVEMEPEAGLTGDVNRDGEVNIADVNAAVDDILSGNGDTPAADVNGDGEVTIADVNAILAIILGGGSPSQDDHEYVDLGLPSGTLWATCNIGATNPEDYGDYFAWGETAPKDNYEWFSYKWYVNYKLTKYYAKDGKTELDPEDDAAQVNWGSSWRMPSVEQINELIDNCSWQRTTMNGVVGQLATGPNGNTLFLPATGYHYDEELHMAGNLGLYWARTLSSFNANVALSLYFNSEYTYRNNSDRCSGLTVRAVRAPQN